MKCLIRNKAVEKACREYHERKQLEYLQRWGISSEHLSWIPDRIYEEVEIPDFDY